MASINDLRLNGLATGIDSATIIDGLTSINQKRIDQLTSKKASIVQQQTTFSGLQAKLLDFQGRLTTLSRSVAGAFEGREATVSDDAIATAAASSTAQTGTFSIRVDSLAQAQQIASQGFADPSSNIKEGTLELRVGSGSTSSVTIDSTNNTLQGLVTAINNSGGDVKASIVKDGTATPFRLLLTSSKTGAENTIQITNNLNAGTGSDVTIDQTVQAAADAQVRLGTGPGAIVAQSATNQVSDLIDGVTLNLKQADPTKTVTLSVENDTDAAKAAVKDLVDSFNSVIDFIDERDNFDSQTQTAGVLLGNRDVSDLQKELQNVLGGTVPGLNSKANSLTAIGVTFGSSGRLQVNEGRLDDALKGKIDGVTLNDVRKLFALTGSSTNPGVSFLLGSNNTKPTAANRPVQVDVTTAARRASISGASALAGTVTITSANNNFVIRVNGISSTLIALPPGDYNSASLAAAIQSRINADARLLNNDVAVDLDVGKLRIQSQAFGSSSNISFESGTALGAGGPLGFLGTESGAGVNVAGTFTVGGVTEAATGVGQILTGKSGNATTDGLQVKVTLGDNDIGAAPDASVSVTQGVASRLNQVLNRFIDPTSGRFKSIDDRFVKNIANIDSTVTRQNEILDQKKEQLVQQFAAMESAVSQLRNLGDQITAQLSSTTTRSR